MFETPRSRITASARRSLALSAALVAGFGDPAIASAAPKTPNKEAAATQIEHRALRAATAGDTANSIVLLKQALDVCGEPAACSVKMKARLHIHLGTVQGVGEGDFETAKKEFIIALTLDPDATLRARASRQLRTAFEDARIAARAPATEPPPPEPPPSNVNVRDLFRSEIENEPAPKVPSDRDKPPPSPTTLARFNWFSVRTMVDFTFISDANICSPGAPSAYFCSDERGDRYVGRPQPNRDVSQGFAPSTMRLVLGYERLLFAGLSVGAFAGVAFPFVGAPNGRPSMWPLHLEARVSYMFGAAPYEDTGARFAPFVFASLGAAQLDSHVSIKVTEIPCGTDGSQTCQRDLDVNRRAKTVFTSLGGGVRFRVIDGHALRAGLRGMLVFGSEGAFAFSPELAYELGF